MAAGCGGDDEGKPIPAATATALNAQLDGVQARLDNGSAGACKDILEGPRGPNLEQVNQIIDSMPDDVDSDIRSALQDSFDNLWDRVQDECDDLSQKQESQQPDARPRRRTTETTTTPTETTTTPTETTTTPTSPDEAPLPNDGDGNGGGGRDGTETATGTASAAASARTAPTSGAANEPAHRGRRPLPDRAPPRRRAACRPSSWRATPCWSARSP